MRKNESRPCESGKKYKDCCINTNLGRTLDLKGKNAENFVYQLSQKSFFTDWCYRNPRLPNGKEICDLLVVFDQIAIIWQIKDLKLDENSKYKISEVKKNEHQLITAMHRLFETKILIKLENPRRGTEVFDPRLIKEVHLISALLGKGEDYFSFSEVIKGRVVHTFTREFTEIALNELDTIQDFVNYLREKENLVLSGKRIVIFGGEHELLAFYLMNERGFDDFKKAHEVIISDGSWKELQKRPEYVAKKKEDNISYIWDEIINRAHTAGGEYEKVAREMARINRFERRHLSKAFFEAHVIAHRQKARDTFRRIVMGPDTTYCFMFLDDHEPRTIRRNLLGALCFVARGIYQNNTKVLGIATEMKTRQICSYDFCLLEIPKWTSEAQKEMERIQKETGILTHFERKIVHEDEYPQNQS